jgi:hypothetical protein
VSITEHSDAPGAQTVLDKSAWVTPRYQRRTAAQGMYRLQVSSAAVVAAALAQNSSLFSMRLNPTSGKRVYLWAAYIRINAIAAFTAPGGDLMLQRFSAATPTAGTGLTLPGDIQKYRSDDPNTELSDVRFSNAALTVAGVAFDAGRGPAVYVPQLGANTIIDRNFYDPNTFQRPLELAAGEGFVLRNPIAAMGAGGTWLWSLALTWEERTDAT